MEGDERRVAWVTRGIRDLKRGSCKQLGFALRGGMEGGWWTYLYGALWTPSIVASTCIVCEKMMRY